MSAQASAERARRLRVAGGDQDQGRQHRRRVGGDAEQPDVAALHADVPDVEGEPDRPEPERQDGEPLRRRLPARPSSRRRDGRRGSRPRWRGRSPPPRPSAPRRSGATGPNSPTRRRRRRRRTGIPASARPAPRGRPGRRMSTIAPAKPRSAPATWAARRRSPGRKRREQHDQQRPEIADEARLRRRREAQGREVEGVVAEQPADPERPHDGGLPQAPAGPAAGRRRSPRRRARRRGRSWRRAGTAAPSRTRP